MNKEEAKKRFPHVTFYGDVSIKDNVKIGAGTKIGEYVVIGSGARIGNNCSILYHVTICKGAIIGDNVFIGPKTTFLNDKYPPTKISQPPIVASDVILGGNVTLCPNSVVLHNSVVGAGSVVIGLIKSDLVYVGNPAKYLMSREKYDEKQGELIQNVKKSKKN